MGWGMIFLSSFAIKHAFQNQPKGFQTTPDSGHLLSLPDPIGVRPILKEGLICSSYLDLLYAPLQ